MYVRVGHPAVYCASCGLANHRANYAAWLIRSSGRFRDLEPGILKNIVEFADDCCWADWAVEDAARPPARMQQVD